VRTDADTRALLIADHVDARIAWLEGRCSALSRGSLFAPNGKSRLIAALPPGCSVALDWPSRLHREARYHQSTRGFGYSPPRPQAYSTELRELTG
jgi:hypothetical protein